MDAWKRFCNVPAFRQWEILIGKILNMYTNVSKQISLGNDIVLFFNYNQNKWYFLVITAPEDESPSDPAILPSLIVKSCQMVCSPKELLHSRHVYIIVIITFSFLLLNGDLNNVEKKAIFLTVHDIGSNHSTFQDFVEHPCMSEIKPRSVFIHIDVPGQNDNADDLPSEFVFPTIQQMGEDLVSVLDHLKVKLVVGFGEGAGANILVRFALAHPSRVLGLVLIHCVSTGVGMMEYFKDKFMNWKLSNVGMNPSAEQYLVLHKFGAQLENVENKETLIQDYTEKLKNKINPRNLRRYVESYMNRKDITSAIETNLKQMDVLLISGGRAAHLQAVQNLYARMDKQKTSFLKLDSVGDVFAQAPEKLSQSLLLFVKGLGYLTSVTMPGVERQRTFSGGDPKSLGAIGRRRTLSMEEYDMPRPRRLSLTIPQK